MIPFPLKTAPTMVHRTVLRLRLAQRVAPMVVYRVVPGAEDSTGSYLAELDTGEGELCDT